MFVLKGKWGTGKTRLWHEINNELDRINKQSIYVSVFGAKTINELKLRILQNAYLNNAKNVKKIFKTGSGFLSQFLKKYTGYSAEDGVLLWLPDVVKGKLIVIDDIERKHKSLDIDEFLGLLDEYSEQYKTRFLILLNTDKLNDVDAWASLHEKVIDIEITLDPSSSEAFDIAADGRTEKFLSEAKRTVEILNINNIRVIKKIIKVIDHIIEASEMNDIPASNWIPSTVLLTATHFRAIENPPSFGYMMRSPRSLNYLMLNEEKKNRLRRSYSGDRLLNELGISLTDEYEKILYGYLESGLIETDSLKAQFSKYKYENRGQEVYDQLKDFFTNVYWNHQIAEDELLSMAEEFLSLAGELGYNTISSIISTIEELGNPILANSFLDIWLQAVDEREGFSHLEAMTFGNECHPRIKEKLKEIENKRNPPLSLTESVERIIEKSSWGDREKSAFGNSTIQQYEDTLREINNDTLRRFIQIHIEWIRKPYDEAFKKGVDNFVAACTKIYSDESTSRLSKIIYRAFESEQLTEKLICS